MSPTHKTYTDNAPSSGKFGRQGFFHYLGAFPLFGALRSRHLENFKAMLYFLSLISKYEVNNNCWWWLLLKSTNYLSNISINYAIIINKCVQKSYHSGGTWMVFHQCEAFHALSGRHSVQKSCHSGGTWMVFHQCEAFHALSGCHSGWISCHSWMVLSRAFIKWQNWMTSLLNLTQHHRMNEWFKW